MISDKRKTLKLQGTDETGKVYDILLTLPIEVVSEQPIQEKPKEVVENKPSVTVQPTEETTFKCPECGKDLGNPEKTWTMTNPRPTPENKLRKMTIGLFRCCGKPIRQVIKTEFIDVPKSTVKAKAEKKTVELVKPAPKKRGRKSKIEKARMQNSS
jgi:predicted RNA-binding Zn-ribbon protein involved in translation (DUF1610 family)